MLVVHITTQHKYLLLRKSSLYHKIITMKIVFTGIQGCGKGTQARKLVENYGFTLVEMGNEFRKVLAEDSELWRKVKEIVEAGLQVPQDIGEEIMANALERYKNIENVIFDGFVRNERNKNLVSSFFPDYQVIFFELSVEKAMQRILGRMFDPESGETFPAGTLENPKTGTKLIKRNDDNEEAVIMKRIEEYQNFTLPIVEQQTQENRVIKIDADQNIEKIHGDMVQYLWLKK